MLLSSETIGRVDGQRFIETPELPRVLVISHNGECWSRCWRECKKHLWGKAKFCARSAVSFGSLKRRSVSVILCSKLERED